jgi:hypothetical protein
MPGASPRQISAMTQQVSQLHAPPPADTSCLGCAPFYAGFACLPMLWLVNVWLFWPQCRTGSDSVIRYCELGAAHPQQNYMCLPLVQQRGCMAG